jgi:triphosphatase
MGGAEIELKLRVRPEDFGRLSKAPPLAKANGAKTTRTLQTIYFDTHDRKLRQAGAVLRVRRQGKQFIQTVKTAGNGSAGLQQRGEWETPVPTAAPDLAVTGDRLPPIRPADLEPLFESRVRRTTRLLDGIEVSFDRGEIRTPAGAAEAVSEIELELKSGSARALFDLALELARVAPVQIEPLTKSERGYVLAGETRPSAVHASPLDLDRDGTAEAALEAILRHCLGHLTANQPLVLDEEGNAEALHQMRVALRRLRSALSMFRPLLPPPEKAGFVTEAKWLADTLGEARDRDVFVDETLAPVQHAFPDDPAFDALAADALASRRAAHEAAREAIRSPRYTHFVLRLGAWVEDRGWRHQQLSERNAALFGPVGELASQLLEKRHRQAQKRGRDFAELDADRRHELRIAVKKLRYAADFFRSLYGAKDTRKYLKRLTDLQGALGRINDFVTARRLLAIFSAGAADTMLAAEAAGRVVGWHARGVSEAEAGLREDWQKFSKTTPFWL